VCAVAWRTRTVDPRRPRAPVSQWRKLPECDKRPYFVAADIIRKEDLHKSSVSQRFDAIKRNLKKALVKRVRQLCAREKVPEPWTISLTLVCPDVEAPSNRSAVAEPAAQGARPPAQAPLPGVAPLCVTGFATFVASSEKRCVSRRGSGLRTQRRRGPHKTEGDAKTLERLEAVNKEVLQKATEIITRKHSRNAEAAPPSPAIASPPARASSAAGVQAAAPAQAAQAAEAGHPVAASPAGTCFLARCEP
jgi:hypothetical protein